MNIYPALARPRAGAKGHGGFRIMFDLTPFILWLKGQGGEEEMVKSIGVGHCKAQWDRGRIGK